MPIVVYPPKPLERKLAKAVFAGELSLVKEALEAGANPKAYLSSWGRSLFLHAVMLEKHDIAEALLAAGADPWSSSQTQDDPEKGKKNCAGWDQRLRHHPYWSERMLALYKEHLDSNPAEKRQDLLAFNLDADQFPREEVYRQLALTHPYALMAGRTAHSKWQVAMASQTPHPMQSVMALEGAPAPRLMVAFLSVLSDSERNRQTYPPLSAWVVQVSPEDRIAFFAGNQEHPGALHVCRKFPNRFQQALWEQAMEDPAIAAALVEQKRLEESLIRGVRLGSKVSLGLLDSAREHGLNLESITYSAEKHDLGCSNTGLVLARPPQSGDNLLDLHLARPDADIAVAVIRRLIKEGCAPSYRTVSLLAQHIHSDQDEKKLLKVFELMWSKGADPEPEGETPIWDLVYQRKGAALGEKTKAAYKQWRLVSHLNSQDKGNEAPARKTRL